MSKQSYLATLLREARDSPSVPNRQTIAFHGTRCPTEILLTKGLTFDVEFLTQKLREYADAIGIDFQAWSQSKRGGLLAGQYKMRKLRENSWRSHVWVSSNPRHVIGFAKRNPEFLFECIESMMVFKHPNRSSRKFWNEELPAMQKRLLRRIGTPKIVTIDLKQLGEEPISRYVTNHPLAKAVPTAAILKVKELV